MSPGATECIDCAAELEPDQEYCLRCGARQTAAPAPHWRRALISAGITTGLAVLALAIGYERMRDDAQSDARSAGRAESVRPAEASDRATASGTQAPVLKARLAARRSP
jgi:hypothetical protein